MEGSGAANRSFDVWRRPAARVAGGVHQSEIAQPLEDERIRLARIVAVNVVHARNVLDESPIGLGVYGELADVTAGESSVGAEASVRSRDALAARSGQALHHERDLRVQWLHLRHHVSVALRMMDAAMMQAYALAKPSRRELGEDARAGGGIEAFDAIDVEIGQIERSSKAARKEGGVQVRLAERAHRTVASEPLVRRRELARGDRRKRRQLEREAEPSDDLGEAPRAAVAAAPHHREQRVLSWEMRSATDGADDQAWQEEARANPATGRIEIQHTDR